MSTLQDLLARVEAATGADRELDAAILDATNPHAGQPAYGFWMAAASAFGWDTRVTSSLDAALALVERVLPGARYVVSSEEPATTLIGDHWLSHKRAKTPPLSVCAALLKALIAKEAA